MSRIAVLRRHPKRTLAGLSAALLATAVAVGSGADFTSSSSNTTNLFTAGVLTHSNTPSGKVFDGTAAASFSNIQPGFGTTDGNAVDTSGGSAVNYGKVVLANSGTLAQNVALTKTVTSAAGSNSTACGGTCQALSGALKVRVVKDGATGSPVYDGLLSGISAGWSADNSVSYAVSDSHTYELYFYLPKSTTGNAFQGGNAQLQLSWAGTQAS